MNLLDLAEARLTLDQQGLRDWKLELIPNTLCIVAPVWMYRTHIQWRTVGPVPEGYDGYEPGTIVQGYSFLHRLVCPENVFPTVAECIMDELERRMMP